MKKMMITNPDGTKMNVDLIRYFKFRNNCYLIYTIGEFDEKNYQKLYLMKVLEELGVPVIQNIKDEAEWKGMQKIVKKVIKEIKSNKMVETKDLDYSLIDGIKISNPRFFKLDQKLVNVLSSNYFDNELSSDINQEQIGNIEPIKVEDNENVSENIIPEVMPVENSGLKENTLNEEQNNLDNIVPNVEPIKVEDNENISENIIPEVMPVENSEPKPVELQNVGQTMDVVPQIEEESSNSKIELKDEDVSIDYKELYLTLKKENESVNETMETILNELIKYKEKYGELDS